MIKYIIAAVLFLFVVLPYVGLPQVYDSIIIGFLSVVLVGCAGYLLFLYSKDEIENEKREIEKTGTKKIIRKNKKIDISVEPKESDQSKK